MPDSTHAGVQNIQTSTIGFTTANNVLLVETAANGGGEFYPASSAASLATAFSSTVGTFVAQVQASFSASVVPSSRIGTGNAFYNAYFVSSGEEPVWEGHTEALKIDQNGHIRDDDDEIAFDTTTGEPVADRNPFWDAGDELKTHTSRTLYTTVTNTGPPVTYTRNVMPVTGATDTILNPGATPPYAQYPASATNGINTRTELRDALSRYLHGKDGFDEDDDNNYTEMRDIVLGDTFHGEMKVISRPTRVNISETSFQAFYTKFKNRKRVVYVGANDNLVHAFDARDHATGNDPETTAAEAEYWTMGTGAELWAWVPGFMQGSIKFLPRNAPRTRWFMDGPMSVTDVWLGDGSGSDTSKSEAEWSTVLITQPRDDARGYLALDVTDPSGVHRTYPGVLWEFQDEGIAATYSQAIVTKLKLRAASSTGDKCGADNGDGDCREQWVAIFAGGYQTAADPHRYSTYNPTASTRGRTITIVTMDKGEILARVEASDPDMDFTVPATPAVVDVDYDGFADVIYVGDLGGQVWKWDISEVGEDTVGSDGIIDNWPYGVFFRSAPVTLSSSDPRYHSFYTQPVASFSNGQLYLALASGERNDLLYGGDTTLTTDQDRFYVVRDPHPTGTGAFPGTLDDTDLTDVTGLDYDNNPADYGYYWDIADGEKFVTEIQIFAGFAIVGSYTPVVGADICNTSQGQSYLNIFSLKSGKGYFDTPTDPPSEERRLYVGGGFPSNPTVIVGDDPDDDVVLVKTSDGPKIITVDAPPRTDPKGSYIYWKVVN